jgi:hypothetical protein
MEVRLVDTEFYKNEDRYPDCKDAFESQVRFPVFKSTRRLFFARASTWAGEIENAALFPLGRAEDI